MTAKRKSTGRGLLARLEVLEAKEVRKAENQAKRRAFLASLGVKDAVRD